MFCAWLLQKSYIILKKIVHLRHLTLVCENNAFSSQQFWNSKHLEHQLFELSTFDRTNIFHDRGWILILKCNTHYWSWFTAGTFHFAGMKSIYSFRITVTFVVWDLMVSFFMPFTFFGLFSAPIMYIFMLPFIIVIITQESCI